MHSFLTAGRHIFRKICPPISAGVPEKTTLLVVSSLIPFFGLLS